MQQLDSGLGEHYRALDQAQRDADRSGKSYVVLNLNPFGALWVVRNFDPRMADEIRAGKIIIVTPH